MAKKNKSTNDHKQHQSRKCLEFLSGQKFINRLVGAVVIILLFAVGVYCYLYLATPGHIRKPTYQHYHFRTQILVNGQAVDFSQAKFQEEYKSVACSAEVGGTPIDFHDKMDQMTHIHWGNMTGGEFLKYFGWNFIGGNGDLMGYRYDDGLVPVPVKIYGRSLPTVPEGSKYYIYIGNKDSYKQKNWDDFLSQDIETFIGKKSAIGHDDKVSSATGEIIDWLSGKVYAHGEVMDGHNTSDKSEEELIRINNLVGKIFSCGPQN